MTDSWTDSNGDNIPSDWTPGGPLTPADEWAPGCGCAPPDGPSIANSVTITGSPGGVTSVQNGKALWSLVLNDGTPAADFRIDRFDDAGELADSPMTIVRATGVVSFHDPVMLAADPVEDLEAATKEYVDNTGLREAPMDQQTYGRDMGAWVALPSSYMPEAPNTSQLFGRFNSTWALVPIQADAPSDGGTYGRMNGAWNAALALTGGTITGSLTVNNVLTVQGSNSLVLNAPVTGGNQRSILGMASNIARWILTLGDQTTEGAGNAGSNFALAAYSTTGAFLGNWLTIARADGAMTINGSGVTIQGGLAVNGLLALASLNNLAIYGGNPGDVVSTNGSGILSWAPRVGEAPNDGQFYARRNLAWAVAPGGMTDAPNDGTAYARKSQAWAHLTHADITDWTAALAPYALTTSVPIASATLPLMDGTAAAGASAAFARGDHVHPSDTSRLALIGGIMAGPLQLANDPVVAMDAATKRYVDAQIASAETASAFGGFVNKFRNATMDVWQRGPSVAVPIGPGAVFTADGWLVVATGAATSVVQNANNRVGGSRYYLAIQAASGLTGFNIRQRIESQIAAPLAGQTCTFSGWMYNNTAASATPTLTVNHPTAENNFTSTANDLAATALQPCPPGAWTRVAYTWAQPQASQSLGLEIVLNLGGALNAASGSFILSDVDLRATPGVATGLNANPPPPELRPVAIEIPYCQRYYLARGGYGTFFCGNVTTGSVYYAAGGFPSSMRAAPTIVLTGNTGSNNFPATVGTVGSSSINGFLENRTASATSVGTFGSTFTASADL